MRASLAASATILVACLLAGARALPPAGAEEETILSPALTRSIQEEVHNALSLPPAKGPTRQMPDLSALALETPLDLGWEGGTSELFFPRFRPALHPERNLDQLCGREFFTSRWMLQTDTTNPMVNARDELRLLKADPNERRRRAPWVALYALLHRGTDEWAADTVLATLKPGRYMREEVFADVAAGPLLRHLPPSLTGAATEEGFVPVDLRVFSNVSYDCAASLERSLTAAAKRGVRAVVVADRSRVDGAQLAGRVAARLKGEGKLPADFTVLPGQIVDTTAGEVLALFPRDIIPRGMTLRKAVDQIHHDGGLAYLVHPGFPGAPERLHKLDFDGYMLQPGVFEAYRITPLVGDPTLADKPAIAGSNALYGETAGLPFTAVGTTQVSGPAIKEALQKRRLYPAAGLYLPWMTAASFDPVARFAGLLDRFHQVHRFAEVHVARWIGADCLTLTTNWDDEIRSIMDMSGIPGGIRRLAQGTSPLREGPRLQTIAAEYSYWRIGYDRPSNTVFLGAVAAW